MAKYIIVRNVVCVPNVCKYLCDCQLICLWLKCFFVGVGWCMNFLFFWRGICLYWVLVGVCDEIKFVYYDLILSCCYYKYKTYFSVLPVFLCFCGWGWCVWAKTCKMRPILR
mgnify:CR=1 FL=1